MSKMCNLGTSCSSGKGMCIHEKLMSGMVAVMMAAGIAWMLV